MRTQVCALCVAVLVTCAAWAAVAGDKQEAKQLFDAGLKLMSLDDFAGASANFERSVALYPTQNSLFNLANCYKALQRYGDAIVVIERLRKDFAGKLKPEIKDAVERQQQEIYSLVARLTIQTTPAEATVSIDGKDVGTGPTLGPLLLGSGEHEIEAARLGHRSQRRSVKLVSGAARTEKFVLEGASGNLVVRANVAGAAVFVDGRQVGTTPLDEPLALCSPIPNRFSISCSVAAGMYHSCGLKTDGTVVCWGWNQALPPAGTFASVSAGMYHSCGVKTDGTLACWGNNAYGQATPPTM